MMKALRLCEQSVTLSTPHVKPRSLYQLYHRIASIHHRLASLYHNSYRNQVRLSKKLLWFLSEKEKVLNMNLEMNDPVPWCIMSVLGRELVCVFSLRWLTCLMINRWLGGRLNDVLVARWIERFAHRPYQRMDRRTDWLTDFLNYCLTGWLIDWLTGWLTYWYTDWMTIWLFDWLTNWMAGWLAGRQTG